jgi:O-acetyl-ADP-ribose deacetylase (regulator of RNase III)
MVRVLVGDMFETQAQTLVNTVNCVGVMGKGLALEFKKRFPDMYEDYVQRCAGKRVRLGEPYLYRRLFPPWILNFPTKDHWRSASRLADIEAGLDYLEQHYAEWGIESLAVPALGCSNGGLEWRVVGPTLYRHLEKLTIPVELYAPLGTPVEQLQPMFLVQPTGGASVGDLAHERWKINPAWVALVEILARIEREPYHAPVGRTIFQKIAYFATESGLPTGLHYQRDSYGPFSPEVKPLVTKLVNNGLLREERRGSMFVPMPGPTYEDTARLMRSYLEVWETLIERVVDLFLRIRHTDQAEIAATVHFAASELSKETEDKPTETDVLREVMEWKQRRKPPLEEVEVAETIRGLGVLRWLDVAPSVDLPVSEEALLHV